jgi:hypothetical protein
MGSVINGDRWISERLAFLRSRLEADISDEERTTIEKEIAVLSEERGILLAGLRVPRWLRRFRRNA